MAPSQLPLPQPDVGDFQARRPRPRAAGDGPGDDAAIGGQLVEPDLSGVALGDRVRGQEAELAPVSQQRLGPQEEVGTQVGTAPSCLWPSARRGSPGSRSRGCPVIFCAAHERRIADEGIEPAPVEEDLGELQRPVEPARRCPAFSQPLLRLRFQLLDGQILELVLDLGQHPVQRPTPTRQRSSPPRSPPGACRRRR